MSVSRRSSDVPKTVRRCNRTFTGCWSCRSRKVKCDEATPGCTQCRKIGTQCLGYGFKLVWVTSDQKTYKPNGRRELRCDLTWAHVPTLESHQVEHFISLCDSAEHVRGSSVQWSVESNVPFGVFPGLQFRQSLANGSLLKDEEAFLFKHYVDHVALIMMPYDDHRSPWKSEYPAQALLYNSQEQRALFHAMLAQSALNLAHLGCSQEKLMLQAVKYYSLALHEAQKCMEAVSNDYAGFTAAVSTLMFVEVYSGHSGAWRAHFNGAWAFLHDQESVEPWNLSAFAWATTQSLCLINIVNETSIKNDRKAFPGPHQGLRIIHRNLVSFVSSATAFGFTIGATQLLMTCIMDIRKLESDLRDERNIDIMDEAVNDLYSRLKRCRETQSVRLAFDEVDSMAMSKEEKIAWFHLNAFIAATHIYLHRTVFDLPPSSTIIKKHVGEVFENVGNFLSSGGGNLSLWPAFIAAVEAYEVGHVTAAKEFLKFSTNVGMGNRLKSKAIVEEVWRLRENSSATTGTDPGNISVDWRDVMVDLDMDILLV